MTSLVDCADKAVRAGAWESVERGVHGMCDVRRHVYHYETDMLSFVVKRTPGTVAEWDGNLETVDYSIGHGSVSDQNGMNKLFARLSMPLVYLRDGKGGGARVEVLSAPQYRWGITVQERYDRILAKMRPAVSVDHVVDTWPTRKVVV